MITTSDIYRPGIWNGFFTLVGTAAATLTGLVFVSLSLNTKVITKDATHRNRAIGTLTGLAAVFMTCAFSIMGGQNQFAVGAEWLTVACIAATIFVNGYVQSLRIGRSSIGLTKNRLLIGTACYAVEIVGAVVFMAGHAFGIYLAAVAMVTSIPFLISGAWLLMVGVPPDATKK